MRVLSTLFLDKQGHLSSKRIAGYIMLFVAIYSHFRGIGEIDIVKVFIYAAVGALGIGVFEKSK